MKRCQLLELIRSIPTLSNNLIKENTSAKMSVEGNPPCKPEDNTMDVHGITHHKYIHRL